MSKDGKYLGSQFLSINNRWGNPQVDCTYTNLGWARVALPETGRATIKFKMSGQWGGAGSTGGGNFNVFKFFWNAATY